MLLFVLLALWLRLQNVVHQIINVHLCKLLIHCFCLLVSLCLVLFPLALVRTALLLRISTVAWFVAKEVAGTCFCHTFAFTFVLSLHLALAEVFLVLSTIAVLRLASTGLCCISILGLLMLHLSHLLILLLQLKLLLLCKLGPCVLVQIIVERLEPVE